MKMQYKRDNRYVLQKLGNYGWRNIYYESDLERLKKLKRKNFWISEYKSLRIVDLKDNVIVK